MIDQSNGFPNTSYSDYISEGFIPLLCKGCHSKHNRKKDYETAKKPVFTGWNSPGYVPPTLKEMGAWERAGGWIGWVIPKGVIALDIEDPDSIAYAREICRTRCIEPAIHQTNNGLHLLFATGLDLSAASEVFTKCGLKVTYRVGGKNYLILAPASGRTWGPWKKPEISPALSDIGRMISSIQD